MKIRKIKYRSGALAWQLDLGLVIQGDGSRKRVQTYFQTKDEASAALSAAKAKRARHGDAALSLSEDERVRFSAARDQLASAGATIEQAVAHFLRHSKMMREAVTLGDLLGRCLEDKARLGKRARYLGQLKCACLNFVRGRESQPSHTVTRDEVEKWVLGQGWRPKTQRVYLGDLRTLFSWGVAKGFLSENPVRGDGVERIELAELERAPIAMLSVGEVRRLLRFCVRRPSRGRKDFRGLLWYAVLGIFCGIRPEELEKMERGAVDFVEGHVVVEASQAKTRKRRVVDLPESARRWLALDSRRDGKIQPTNFRRRWEALRALAGLIPWAHDVMRHTFASMHYASHQDERALKAQMGHSDGEDTLMQHYRALVSRREAREFWEAVPSGRRRIADCK